MGNASVIQTTLTILHKIVLLKLNGTDNLAHLTMALCANGSHHVISALLINGVSRKPISFKVWSDLSTPASCGNAIFTYWFFFYYYFACQVMHQARTHHFNPCYLCLPLIIFHLYRWEGHQLNHSSFSFNMRCLIAVGDSCRLGDVRNVYHYGFVNSSIIPLKSIIELIVMACI